MEFRPCIDIHNGKVKQIVGGSLSEVKHQVKENFVSKQDAVFFAELYKSRGLKGGHVILLNPPSSEYYEETKKQALLALSAYPGGLMVGGGINDKNAKEFLDAGASHVIVTSFVFKDGRIDWGNLDKMVAAVGKEHLVLDLSCRKKDDKYYIVTDRWQKYTDVAICKDTMKKLAGYCDEFLIHAVDVEGKASGIEKYLARMLGKFPNIPITYAGGVHNFEDLDMLRELGNNHVDVTIGSALDIFGGTMEFEKVIEYMK